MNLVKIENGQPVVSSRQIAEDFGKRHDVVLRSIQEIITTQNCGVTKMFFETTYQAGTGKSYKEYLMNRDGFTLLAMGFTGKKAMIPRPCSHKVPSLEYAKRVLTKLVITE